MPDFDKRQYARTFGVYALILAGALLGTAWIRAENAPASDSPTKESRVSADASS